MGEQLRATMIENDNKIYQALPGSYGVWGNSV